MHHIRDVPVSNFYPAYTRRHFYQAVPGRIWTFFITDSSTSFPIRCFCTVIYSFKAWKKLNSSLYGPAAGYVHATTKHLFP